MPRKGKPRETHSPQANTSISRYCWWAASQAKWEEEILVQFTLPKYMTTEVQEYIQSNLRKTTEVWNSGEKNLEESEREISKYCLVKCS